MENFLEDSEIFHSSEDGDVERWLEPRNIPLCLRLLMSCSLLLFYFSYLCGCSSYLISLPAFHPSLSLSVNTHLNKEAIEQLNSLSRGI